MKNIGLWNVTLSEIFFENMYFVSLKNYMTYGYKSWKPKIFNRNYVFFLMTLGSKGIVMANCIVTTELGLNLFKESINAYNLCVGLCPVLTTQDS